MKKKLNLWELNDSIAMWRIDFIYVNLPNCANQGIQITTQLIQGGIQIIIVWENHFESNWNFLGK